MVGINIKEGRAQAIFKAYIALLLKLRLKLVLQRWSTQLWDINQCCPQRLDEFRIIWRCRGLVKGISLIIKRF